jgi:general secretion pathway protein I
MNEFNAKIAKRNVRTPKQSNHLRAPKRSGLKRFNSSKKQFGFTLLEVLIAVAIFALAGAAVVKGAAEHLNAVSMLKNMTFATYVANNQLTETGIRANVSWPPKNNLKGQSEMASQTWHWEQTVMKTADDDLLQVTVTVFENEDLTASVTSVSTFMAKK